jgi:predicted nucleotidyltransferase
MARKKESVVENRIQAAISEIENTECVTVLYACESGSRAWGFASTDSDYDVRFIYLRPPSWYLSVDLEVKRDVIERPITDVLDVSGWDLRKALKLFRKSNPPLLEWLGSPIVYREEYPTASRLRELAKTYCPGTACGYHYLHMAQGNYREYLKGEIVWRKKYFYVLRPLLAIRWLEAGLGVVPTEFGQLVEKVALKAN